MVLHALNYIDDELIDDNMLFEKFIPIAEANDIVLIFPQVNGRWDFGYDNDNSVEEFPNKTYLSEKAL
jgi:hypothetical protein